MSRRLDPTVRRWLIATLVLGLSPLGHAELVSTRLATNQSGHAWLFGSPLDVSCWVAAPAHVFKGPDKTLLRGLLRLRDGTEAQLAMLPAQPDPEVDLAFAPVVSNQRCLDRLGGSDLSRLVKSGREVKLTIVDANVQESIMVRIRSVTAGGDEFVVEPTRTQDRMVQGFSGGLISVSGAKDNGDDVPIGLLIQVCDKTSSMDFDFDAEPDVASCDGENHYGVALRFDMIKAAFLKHAATSNAEPPKANAAKRSQLELLSTSGMTVSADDGPINAFGAARPGACWRVKSDQHGRFAANVRVSGDSVRRLRVFGCDNTAANEGVVGVALSVRQSADDAWSSLRYCRAKADRSPVIDCSIVPTKGREFRLDFKAVDKLTTVAIGAVRLD